MRKSTRRKMERWIRTGLRKGKTKEGMAGAMKNVGWTQEQIDEVFQPFEPKDTTPLPPVISVEEPQEKPEQKGIVGKINELNEKVDMIAVNKKKFKQKGFKLPFSLRMQQKNLYKRGKMLVFLLKENRTILPIITTIKEGMLFIGDRIHNCTMDFIFLYKGKTPCVVLPEWNLNPIGTKDFYEQQGKGELADAQTLVIKAMEHKENMGTGKKLSTKTMIFIIIGIAIIAGIFFMGGE